MKNLKAVIVIALCAGVLMTGCGTKESSKIEGWQQVNPELPEDTESRLSVWDTTEEEPNDSQSEEQLTVEENHLPLENVMQANYQQIQWFDAAVWALDTQGGVYYSISNGEAMDYLYQTSYDSTISAAPNPYFLDESNAWISYGNGQMVVVEHTQDAGVHWQRTEWDLTEYFECAGAFFCAQDINNGYLLVCSSPGAGQMRELILQTHDGGNSFEVVGEISSAIQGYPTGFMVNAQGIAYITVSYHGQDTYLYSSLDMLNWTDTQIDLSNVADTYSYLNAYAPATKGDLGYVVLQAVNESGSEYILCQTVDGGAFWNSLGKIDVSDFNGCSIAPDGSVYLATSDGIYQYRP